MNREDIIRMAREAQMPFYWRTGEITYLDKLERFAALVASAEREVWEHKYARLQSLMDIRETQPNKPCCLAEREACARVCDDIHAKYKRPQDTAEKVASQWCADAIRARGQA